MMPACFQLTRKGDNAPSSLQHIDKVICQNLGYPFSEDRWCCGWYDIIGLMLALGKSFDDIIDSMWEYEDYDRLRIAAYLAEHYTSDAFYQHGWH